MSAKTMDMQSEQVIKTTMIDMGERARTAQKLVAVSTSVQRKTALLKMAAAIRTASNDIVAANSKDLALGQEQEMGS